MIQGSFCSKLNALSYDIYLVFLCLLSFFFLGGRPNFDGTDFFLESNGQKEFQIPLADRTDQVLPLFVPFFFLFFTSFKSYDFLKFCKKYTHCHFVDNKTCILKFWLCTLVEHEMGIFLTSKLLDNNEVLYFLKK